MNSHGRHRIAKALERQKEQVVEEWERRIRTSEDPKFDLNNIELRNSLPEVLGVMVESLSNSDPRKVLIDQEHRLAISHGRSRAEDPNYTLDQVINEYHVLLRVLFDLLEEDGRSLEPLERDLILDTIIVSIRNASTTFKQVQDDQKSKIQQELNRANLSLSKALGKESSEGLLKDHLLRSIFEEIEDYAIFSLDAEGRIASWSEGCRKIKQYAAAEVLGKYYGMLYPPDGRLRDEPEKHLQIAVSEGKFRGEGLRMRKDGNLFLADVFIAPMYGNGGLVGYFKIVTDLTERSRLLQERDLSRSQVQTLQVEHQLREQFVSMLTHDLRNPLAAAKTSAEVINMEPCNVVRHSELAERCVRQLDRIGTMTRNLLDANRIREGRAFPLQIQQFDLSALLGEIRSETVALIGERFRYEAPPSLIGFWDHDGLRRVIENLVSNAQKYGDPKGEITVLAKEIKDRILLKVHNVGSPISEDDQERLFELFHRARPREYVTGWGLGLTLVRGITEAHGGIVKVRSLKKEGTTFILDLPRDARSHASEPPNISDI